jgi:transitional endoplasmic reticulum ATPase
MGSWIIRDMANGDLDGAIKVWNDSHVNSQQRVFSIAEVVTAVSAGAPAVVAENDGHIIVLACSILDVDRAWICRLALSNE